MIKYVRTILFSASFRRFRWLISVASIGIAAACFYPWRGPLRQSERTRASTENKFSDEEGVRGDNRGKRSASGVFTPSIPSYVKRDLEAVREGTSEMLRNAGRASEDPASQASQLGLVKIDAQTKTLSFPARLNMQSGLIEYALVHRSGKIHEALLVTDASPLHIHLAALLLQLAKSEGSEPTEVDVDVEWQPNGPPQRMPLENLIARVKGAPLSPGAPRGNASLGEEPPLEPGEVLERGAWTYSGSILRQGALMAAVDGSIIALIQDPSALVGNPRPGNSNDRLHVPSKRVPPAQNFPVMVHIHAANKND